MMVEGYYLRKYKGKAQSISSSLDTLNQNSLAVKNVRGQSEAAMVISNQKL